MPSKQSRQKSINLAAVAKLRDELTAFAEEFDSSDSEQMEVALDTRISNLISEGFIKIKKNQSNLHLDDVLAYILKISDGHELIENARVFHTLISSYGGEPTDDDMDDAYSILTDLIEKISKTKGIAAPNG
jgi:hypothetical protein